MSNCVKISVEIQRTSIGGKLRAEQTRINASCDVDATEFDAKFRTSCDSSDVKYMRVTPAEVQWINVNEVLRYLVESNVEWQVE